ncbi:hypothetical protein ACR6C2_40570 [Streptomyces sp. INA 01156]
MSEKRWVTFDCFGTLVDWRHGIATGIELVAPGKGWELLDVYNRHEPQVQREHPSMRYGDVLVEALKRTATEAKIDLLEDDARVLTAGIPFWPVFPRRGRPCASCGSPAGTSPCSPTATASSSARPSAACGSGSTRSSPPRTPAPTSRPRPLRAFREVPRRHP